MGAEVGLALVATHLAGLEDLLLRTAATLALPSSDVIQAVMARRQELEEEQRKNQFLFLEQAQKRLKHSP
jgi:hypothetical protein